MAMSRTGVLAAGAVLIAVVAVLLRMNGDGEQMPAGEAAVATAPTAADAELSAIREATTRFLDVEVALAEGYIPDPGNACESAGMMGQPAELGAMGIHYFRPDLLGIAGPPNPRVSGSGIHTDFMNPAVLIYEPQADGSLVLVAVEISPLPKPGRLPATPLPHHSRASITTT